MRDRLLEYVADLQKTGESPVTGPKWEMDDEKGFMVSASKPDQRIWIGWPCAACGETGANDKATGYCRACWRAAVLGRYNGPEGYTAGMFTGGDGKP